MDRELRGRFAIVGVAESALGKVAGRSLLSLQAEAATAAVADAGLPKDAVDGIFTAMPLGLANMAGTLVSEYLGLRPRYTDATMIGGPSFVAQVGHAMAALHAGQITAALIVYGSTQRSDRWRRPEGVWGSKEPPLQWEVPYGLPQPIGGYAMMAQRHMHLYGTTSEQMAQVAVAARQWAQLNPKAASREPLSVEDVLASPMLTTPLHVLDCCLISDGGGAVVLTSAERARDLPKSPVYVLGYGEVQSHNCITQMSELTSSAAGLSGQQAYDMSGLGPRDMDVIELYDNFTIAVLMELEDLGFCPKGEGGRFVESIGIGPGGKFPLNTSGGGLSYCHPGMFGIFLLIEAVRQLRGEAGDRQVRHAKTALVHGVAGVLSAHSTVVLGAEVE